MAQPVNPAIPVPPVLPPIPWQQQAVVLGLNPDETVLYELMSNFHSFTREQYVALRDQGGYGTLADLNQWQFYSLYAQR